MADQHVDELQAIYKEHRILRAEDVVEFASNPETALHKKFEWDDGKAAQEYRLWQARELIRVSVTILPETKAPIRAFVSLSPDRTKSGGGYRPTRSVLRNKKHREQWLADALDDLRRIEEKYRELQELAPVFEAVKKVAQGRKKTAA